MRSARSEGLRIRDLFDPDPDSDSDGYYYVEIKSGVISPLAFGNSSIGRDKSCDVRA